MCIMPSHCRTSGGTRGTRTLSARREGHFSKVFGVQWSEGGDKLVSAAQDGFMIVWNPLTGNKNITIPLKSTWIMMCAIEPQEGEVRRLRRARRGLFSKKTQRIDTLFFFLLW